MDIDTKKKRTMNIKSMTAADLSKIVFNKDVDAPSKGVSRGREWTPGEKYDVSVEELLERRKKAYERKDFYYYECLTSMIMARTEKKQKRPGTIAPMRNGSKTKDQEPSLGGR